MWSDYFEPDFCDQDSPSYVSSKYLPVFGDKHKNTPGYCGSMWEEINKNPIWDIRNPTQTVVRMLSKSEKLRQYAIEIDKDSKYDSYFNFDTKSEPFVADTVEYIFTFGKYKNKKLSEVLSIDKQYVKWCRQNVQFFNH